MLCRRHFPSQRPPVRKVQPCSRVRPSLEAIAEEACYQHVRRRKQLIPRARLIHHRRGDDQARRSSSLSLQFVSLLTPPPDFRSDNLRTTGQDRQPVSNESENTNIQQGLLKVECPAQPRNSIKTAASVTSSAHRPPRTSAFSTLHGPSSSIIQHGQGTHTRDQDSGNEATKLTQLSANRINDSSDASSQTPNRPTAQSIGRSQNTALQYTQLCSCESAARRHRQPTAHLSTRGRTAQDPDSERGRKRQYVNETSDERENKVSELIRGEAKGKVDCGESGNAECRAGCFEKEKTAGQNNNHLDVEGRQEDYPVGEHRKRMLSTRENPASVRNEGIQRSSNGTLESSQDIPTDKRRTVGLTENPAGNKVKTEKGSAQQVKHKEHDSVTAGRSVNLGEEAGTHVLKVMDSATTAFRRPHDEIQQVSVAKRSPPTSEDCTPKTTQKLRRIFEGGREASSSSSSTPSHAPKESKAAGKLPAPRGTCEMLTATLSVDEANDTLQKLSIRKETDRAFSCSGHGTVSDKTEPFRSTERQGKVAAFDGLLQYLQDYRHGLRQLLVNSNVVIIEPVRQPTATLDCAAKSASETTCRIMGAIVKKGNSTPAVSNTLPRQQPVLRRHFFYHPIRTNRSLVDEELPDPEKVRHAREIFERTIKIKASHKEQTSSASETRNTKNNRTSAPKIINISKSDKKAADQMNRKYLTVDTVFRHKRWTDSGSLSSGVSSDLSCYETDVESPDKDMFSSDDDYLDRSCYVDESDEGHYIAPEILERIRAYGTTVTYYGGQVIAASNAAVRSPMTLAIMDEIEKNQRSVRKETRGCLGVKFRLVKSNSCGSRLELAGTQDDDMAQHPLPKQDAPTENVDESKGRTQAESGKSSQTAHLDSVTESRSSHGHTDTTEGYMSRAPFNTCFPPERAGVVERGSNVLFNDIEFEEYEIAHDSLDVIQENDIECNAADEQLCPRGCQPVTVPAMEKQRTSASNVQMTTWATRSVMSEFRNCEAEDSQLLARETEHHILEPQETDR